MIKTLFFLLSCNLATKFFKLLICTVFVLLFCSYFFLFVTVPMSLNVKYTDTKPCSKPYQLTLNDCLACSSCLTQGESGSLHAFDTSKINDFEKISITPHAKINLANKLNADVHIFAKALDHFFDNKILDTSHYYKYITSHDDKIITSECPGVVKYIQRMGHHLIDNLMKIKSTQQIIDMKFRCLHIVTCLDKRLENDGNCITTREMYKYLLDSGFEKMLVDVNSIDKQNDVYKTLQVDLKYIESICSDGVITNIVNDNWIEYRDGDKLYAKISGLPNFINFVNQSRKGMKYNVVEAYICTGGCINGPAQIDGLLKEDKAIKDKFEEMSIGEKIDDNNLRRTFVKEQAKTKTYKVDW